MGRYTNFPPGVTHVDCRICGKPVDVTDESNEWDERLPPAHRLCANSEPAPTFEAPMDVRTMATIWRALYEGRIMDAAVRQNIVDVLVETMNLEVDPEDHSRRKRNRRFYAARLLVRMEHVNRGYKLTNDPFMVSPTYYKGARTKITNKANAERRREIDKWVRGRRASVSDLAEDAREDGREA